MADFQLLGVWTGGSWGMSVGASPNFSSFLIGSRLVWASLLCIIKIRLFFFFKWNFCWILSVPRSLCLPFPRSGAYEKTAPCTQYISYKQKEPSFQTKAFTVMFSENASRLNSSAKDTIKIHLNFLRKPFANTLISILKDRRCHLHWVVICKVTNFVCNVAVAIFNFSEH